MKKNYVDIMSSNKPTGDAAQSQPPSLDGYVPLMPQVAQQPTFFTPSRVEGLENAPYDFITPSSAPRLPESSTEEASNAQPQLSRCSSVSSLSREVQYYMEPQVKRENKFNGAAQPPLMYNRAQMQ
uniref:Putative monoacyl phosphatidylinositol tetramannoside-binding protein LpqW n=1 Tax=Lygus hesperus TaxID=30085 RepID=A0A0A9XH61_LYGHE